MNHTKPQQKLYIQASVFTPIKTSIVSGVALNSYCLISWRNTKATLNFAGVMKVSNGLKASSDQFWLKWIEQERLKMLHVKAFESQ